MRSAVRFAVRSVISAPFDHELRSAGISVLSSHLPFAYRKKSSPGATAGSMAVRSRPDRASPAAEDAGLFAAAGVDGVEASVARTEAAAAYRTMLMARDDNALAV